ncbi:MAG: capsular polysaccharide biosynthesis protein [Aliidiomarina sp.]|uniref:capsular polysaccharide biosynthesis protein n=1 Tax=Aliidiomarina sp. TaxID=1872439 RepID=UPI0025C163D9|nr:capsular polysaccharide biosynthesis protein [Aliidiomarina sp.]MCH8502466.1 capsular polysaccharide biosynthesis protein [Aliidiomarina sp.]
MQPLARPDCFLTTSKGIAAITDLPRLLGAPVEFCRTSRRLRQLQAQYNELVVIAWGRKATAEAAEHFARTHALKLWRCEDGFLRSVELGHLSAPLSVVIDDLGIYYDARQPSRLEQLITTPWDSAEATENEARAQTLIQHWRQARVSKYNSARECLPDWLTESPFVLVVDQTYGDASITYGLADAERFQQMLLAAQTQFPHHRVVVKTHPDVLAGSKRAHFSPDRHPDCDFLADNIHPPALLERADAVFCVTSQMGFEALLWGKPVYTFGMPFYAGWGLTDDALSAPARRQGKPTLAKLVYAALIEYPCYVHPDRQQGCQIEELLPWFALQRQQQERFPPRLWAGRWPRWKKPILERFMRGSELCFAADGAVNQERLPSVGWSASATTDIRVEDGFIRSVGLGADLIAPQSWVFDCLGMYYDATRPSDLERLLLTHTFSQEEIQRATQVQAQLVATRVSKYNVGEASWRRPQTQQPVILIPGQVESDASIQLGSPTYKTNLALIQQVRQAHPDAYLLYKPHPDVRAGLRVQGSAEQRALEYVDEVVVDQDIAHLLEQVDAVHTLTSLSGFEALLRGVSVVCYGQPFYAGWGLTTDMIPPTRRQRRLTLAELVAGTLLLYPTYLSRRTGYFTTVEQVLLELVDARQAWQQRSTTQRWRQSLQTQIRRYVQRLKRF